MQTRSKEQLSWIKHLGSRECNQVEFKVDLFLKKHPTWETYDNLYSREYHKCVRAGDEGGAGMAATHAEGVWNGAIKELAADMGNDDYEEYALRYVLNEWRPFA